MYWINKRWLGKKIMKEFAALTTKIFSYLTDNNEDKKSKGIKKFIKKRKLKFEDYKNCLKVTKLEIK